MKKLFLFLMLISLIITHQSYAQDTLYKTNAEVIVGKIYFIDSTGIRIHREKIKNDSTYFLKSDLAKIKFKNRIEINFTDEVLNHFDEVALYMQTSAAKIEFVSLLAGKIVGGGEVYLKNNRSIDFRAGYIGLDFTSLSDFKASSGFLVKVGSRFYRRVSYSGLERKFVHPLNGNYFMPQLVFSTYKNEKTFKDKISGKEFAVNARVNSYGFNLVFGHQIVGKDGFVFDYSVGLGLDYQQNGYPKDSFVDSDSYDNYNYSHLHIGRSIGLTVSLGFAIGGLL